VTGSDYQPCCLLSPLPTSGCLTYVRPPSPHGRRTSLPSHAYHVERDDQRHRPAAAGARADVMQ
jgi:hypothetical protein